MKNKVILTILFISIFLSVLIVYLTLSYNTNDSGNGNYARPEEVELKIKIKKNNILENEGIQISGNLTIQNIMTYQIFISKGIEFGDNIQFKIYNNRSCFVSDMKVVDFQEDILISIPPNGSIRYNFNLTHFNFYNETGEPINGLKKGKYNMISIYKDDYISDIVQIEVM